MKWNFIQEDQYCDLDNRVYDLDMPDLFSELITKEKFKHQLNEVNLSRLIEIRYYKHIYIFLMAYMVDGFCGLCFIRHMSSMNCDLYDILFI